jgi:hypothetical protein
MTDPVTGAVLKKLATYAVWLGLIATVYVFPTTVFVAVTVLVAVEMTLTVPLVTLLVM